MNRDQKTATIDDIATQLGEASAVLAVDYRGLSVPDAAELRARLREADATFRVVKNSLTERAADKAGAGDLKGVLEGPTAFTFVRGDAALAAKALSEFARGGDPLTFKGGLMNGQGLTVEQITALARLPGREVLYGQLVGTVAAPVTGLVRGLAALISGLARQLQQLHDQGLVGAGETASPSAPEPETSVEAEAPTASEAVASPVDEAPAEARPDEPEPEESAPPGDEGPPQEQVPEEPAEEEGASGEPAAEAREPAERPSDDPDAEPHEAPVQPDQAEGENAPSETATDDQEE